MQQPIRISVDSQICRKDGLCTQVCPTRTFSAPEGQTPQIAHSIPPREIRTHWVLAGEEWPP
jgi:NAD-dependent dihydropyrimidine dehydrogenase PreA subunit